ncbi:MAG: beta-ketoacyl-[acyl-carrier-protein] synthase family protein [Spirochaetes bacterium]|nr:beta-ketoacyl-[acyl-carrier-protein] synthase family protein [Spirochaetota bacterium]
MNNRVFVTGMNVISSLGLNIEENWDNMKRGASGIKKITLFDPSNLQTQIAGQVPDRFEEYSKNFIKKRTAEQMTRVTRMCFMAAVEAVNRSKFDFAKADTSRVGVILGVVSTANTSVEKGTTPKNLILKSMNNAMSAWISLEYKLGGPNFTVSSACSSSAYAMGLAYDMIKSGMADMVITGGADSIINPEEINGFNELYALSTRNEFPERASSPFSKNRDGFVIGEGAGILILESEKSALERDAEIYAELSGYAFYSEGYNIMTPEKDGEGMAKTMEKALVDSGVSLSEVDYINAHGTSTTLNDKYETMAIKKVFKERAYKIAVSSTKSMIGHTIGAAGAIEGAVTALSVKEGIVTPTINYIPDRELDLDYTPNVSVKKDINCAISNSFAFGGHNATIVFKKRI